MSLSERAAEALISVGVGEFGWYDDDAPMFIDIALAAEVDGRPLAEWLDEAGRMSATADQADGHPPAVADPIDTRELRRRVAHSEHGELPHVDLSPGERDRFCDEMDRLRLMLTASEAGAEELSGEMDRLRADLARTAAALEWERRRLDRGVTRTERDALADPPPDTTPRVEDPADMLRDALALMDNGERNYSARERVGLYLVALRESGCALVRSDDMSRLSAENARAQKGTATLQAGLRHIADGQECTTYTSPATCRTSGRTRDAKYGADRWCDACIANDTLTEWEAGR